MASVKQKVGLPDGATVNLSDMTSTVIEPTPGFVPDFEDPGYEKQSFKELTDANEVNEQDEPYAVEIPEDTNEEDVQEAVTVAVEGGKKPRKPRTSKAEMEAKKAAKPMSGRTELSQAVLMANRMIARMYAQQTGISTHSAFVQIQPDQVVVFGNKQDLPKNFKPIGRAFYKDVDGQEMFADAFQQDQLTGIAPGEDSSDENWPVMPFEEYVKIA